ncbi:Dystrophin [Trichinella pseudospiralis]|uniref:Dystrophin n=1 Tax=Trichinella pseudospiralis TaxID=6337 RepID=A0A0V1FKH6_TRIPS|nr:Dystrophin [Trichinella pseudospiralis]
MFRVVAEEAVESLIAITASDITCLVNKAEERADLFHCVLATQRRISSENYNGMFLAASKHLRQLDKEEKTVSSEAKQQQRRISLPAHKQSLAQFQHLSDEESNRLRDMYDLQGCSYATEDDGNCADSDRKSSIETGAANDRLSRIRSGQVTWSTISSNITLNLNVLLTDVEKMSAPNLREMLSSLNEWLEYATCFIKFQFAESRVSSKEALDNLKEKVQFLKKFESAVKRLLHVVECLLQDGSVDSHISAIRAEMQSLSIRWNNLIDLTEMTYESVSNQFDRTPAPHLEQALQSLSEWLDCAEDVIATQDLDSIDELDITAAKIQRLQDLQNEMTVQRENLNFVANAADELLREGTGAYDKLSKKLRSVVPRWTDIERVLTNQLTRLKAGMSKLQDWEFRASELENWMLQVKEFIQAEKPALGNTETLKAQLEQSQALMNDIETLVPKIQQMETWVHELELSCKPRVGEYLRARMEDIDSRWTDVVRVTEAKHESLNKAYTQSKVIFDEVQQLTQWLWSVEQEMQNFGNPCSGKELHTMIKQHKQILDELRSKAEIVEHAALMGEQIIEAANEASDASLQLKRRFLNTREQWSAICQQMEARLSVLTDAFELWKEFQELVAAEKISLDRLEQMLNEPMKSATDAEEFSEQLDVTILEFERLMEGSGGHNRIIEIANTLNNENLLSNAVRNELAKYMAKRDKVLEPAKERQKFLETDAREAQKIEQQLHECLSWISRVDFITRARSECDILASDIPQEYKMLFSRGELLLKLYDEFDEHKECIFDLEKQVAHYQQLGLQQAAGRLAEQVNHLKKQMCDVQSRLEQYKQPSELDDRLRRVERILEDLEQSFTLLTVATDDLDEIDQLLEKVEVTLEALNELQCEIDDLKETASKQNARSSVALDDIDDVENHLKAFCSKICETKENFQEIRRMLATASTNLQNCNERLNDMETNLRKWDPEDAQNFDERCKKCLNYRREISNCNQYLKEMESYVKKFMHITQGQSTSKLDGILLVLRNRIKNLTNKLDEWSVDYQHSKLEQVEAQKKFYNLHAAVSSMLNTAEKEITSSNRDLKVLKIQFALLSSHQHQLHSCLEAAAGAIAKDADRLHIIEDDSGQLRRRWDSFMEKLKEELATRSSSTSESDDQTSISLSMLFGKDGNNDDNDDESNDVSMVSENTIRVGSSTPIASESSDFTDRLLVQTTELAKSINSVEELLGASEQDFKMLQSKIGDVSNTIEACSTNVNQLLHQSEQANKIELRPNVLSIVNKLEHMDSKLKLLDGKIKSIVEANERFQKRYDSLNSNAKNLLSNLVFLETMNTDELKNCQEGLTNVENSLTDLLVKTKEEFQHLDVAFPESSADSLYKLLQQAQSNITVHVKQLEEKANAKAKMDAFISESVKVKEECSELERKLSLCPESENFGITGLTERETEFQDLTENVEQLKDRIGKLWNLHDNVSHQYLDESEQQSVKQIVDELNAHLDSLEKTYMEHFSLFQAALQQWQSLHQRLYSVMAWLEHAENRLIPSISINDPEAAKITDSVMNDINNSCKEIENITEALVDMQDKYSNCLSSTDVSLLKEKLEKATYRLNSLKTKMIENRNRVKHYDLELKEEIEELLFWFDESDTLFSTLCDPTDAKQLADFKQRIEEKKSETVTKEQQLESLSSAVDNIDTDKGISEAVIIDLKENVDNLKQRLVQVKEDVDQKLQQYDQRINQCNQFWDQLRQMSIWAQNMKNLLLEYKSATIYTPARFDPDALDAEIKGKKEEIEDFIASYNAIREEAELSDVKLCSSTEHAVKQLCNSWAGILRMTELFESSSRSTSEEDEVKESEAERAFALLEKSSRSLELESARLNNEARLENDDIIVPSLSEQVNLESIGTSDIADAVVQQDSSTAPEVQRLTSTDSPMSAVLNNGKNLQELIRWSHWLSDMTLESVVFCKLHDSSEIRAAMKKEQSFLSQLHANEKHVLKILETDQNVDVLFKAELLHKEWKKRITEVERRRIELVEMLENCRTWDDLRVEIEIFLASTEKKISSAKVSDVPIDKLQRELVALEQLAAEMDIYRKKMTDFNEISNFIVESYVHDDASTLSQITSNMNTLWSKINDNLRIRKAVLEASCRGRKDFFTALQEFSCWLGKIESQVLSLDADSSLAQLLKDVAYRQELREKWKGVSGEIEVHETVFHSLCDTANTLLMNSMFSEEKSDFQGELMQLNERWEQVVKLSDEIKQRLDLAQEQWERLTTQLQELICWTEDASRELLRQQPIAGDSEKIKLQNEFIQQLQTGISNQEKAVKEIIQIARSYLLQQDLRPALQSSMDSDETEEMLLGKKQSRRVGQMIKNDSDRLEELWADLTDSANDWQKLVEDTFTKMILFDKAIEDCKIAISEAEDLKKHWKPISDVKLDELAECMEHARGFHQYLICHIRLLLDDVNDHSSRLLADNVRLSPAMIHSLESLNLRYKELELTIGDRIVILQNALRQFGPSSQHFLEGGAAGSVVLPWERAVSTNRIPYYINHETEKTQWDHPKMVEIINSFSEFNEVKFSAYRTAMKLRSLQKNLYLDLISIEDLVDIFNQRKLQDANDNQLDVSEMVMTLLPIYELVQRDNMNLLRSIPLAVDLCLNWLLNVYDPARTGNTRVISFKVALILMCRASLSEKYRYLFNQVSYNKCSLDQKKLALLLHECIQVPKFFGEVAAFGGTNIEPSVRSCFEMAKYPAEVTMQQCMDWLNCEPQSIVWLAAMHRISISENEKHQAKCNVCKMFPVVGLRYRCLKCFNFDMCQNCFFAQRTAKNHKISHPMQEYYRAAKSGEDVRDFGRVIRNRFKSKHYWKKHPRLGYLPVQSVMEGHSLESRDLVPTNPETQNIHVQIEMYASHLADMERSAITESNESEDDEHAVISSLSSTLTNDCHVKHPVNMAGAVRSPAQIISVTDSAQKVELNGLLKHLQNENKNLMCEYEKLRNKVSAEVDKGAASLHNSMSTPMLPMTNGSLGRRGQHRSTSSLSRTHHQRIAAAAAYDDPAMDLDMDTILSEEKEMIANEAKVLRQQKQRLEQRSKVLEEHNQQLEVQLRRIKQLIEEQKQNGIACIDSSKSQLMLSSGISSQADAMTHCGNDDSLILSDTCSSSSNRIGDLMSTVQDIGKAVGNLINAVTSDDEVSMTEVE